MNISVDDEWAEIGCLLLGGPYTVSRVCSLGLNCTHFQSPPLAAAFSAVVRLTEQGIGLDRVTLRQVMRDSDSLPQSDVETFIHTCFNVVPGPSNALWHARRLMDRALTDSCQEALSGLSAEVKTWEGSAQEFLGHAQSRLMNLGAGVAGDDGVSVAETIDAFWDRLEADYKNPGGRKGLPTGIGLLDYYTDGLCPGRLYLLAARAKVGKTSMAINIGSTVAEAGGAVHHFSQEMNEEEVKQRMLFSLARVPEQHYKDRTLTRDDSAALCESRETMRSFRYVIHDETAMTPALMMARCRRAAFEKRLDLVIVDYLQLLRSDSASGGRRYENRQQEVAAIARDLKVMAGELSVPVLALCQLNRAVEMRSDKTPQLHDLRESGALEQDANVVMLLYAGDKEGNAVESDDPFTRAEDDYRTCVLSIAANRHGPKARVPLKFFEAYTRFEGMDLGAF